MNTRVTFMWAWTLPTLIMTPSIKVIQPDLGVGTLLRVLPDVTDDTQLAKLLFQAIQAKWQNVT